MVWWCAIWSTDVVSLLVACFTRDRCNPNHSFESVLPQVHVPVMLNRMAVIVLSRYFDVSRCHTLKLGRSFVLACVQFSNYLDDI
mgnify:CR=1 FL=1